MNYRETTEYLFTAMPSFQNIGGEAYKPGLERIEEFCRKLGNPQCQYPTIHIAGTNGKGSTSNMLASALHAAGLRVGLFTSPHLRDFRERIRVDGETISEWQVVEFVAQHREAMEQMSLSFFEMTAAMAFDHFREMRVDVAVIECGLGGRLDATNIVRPILSVITNIGLDHTQYLGDTLPQIAAEKGGIIKRGVTVVVGERNAQTDVTFEEIARRNGSRLIFAEDDKRVVSSVISDDYQQITISQNGVEKIYSTDLKGEYQQHNILTLLTAVEVLNAENQMIPRHALNQGLREVTLSMKLEGRWQQLSTTPLSICDTGHNLHGMREITRQIANCRYDKLYCVLGFARDKDLREILPLFPAETHFIFTRAKVERAFTTAEIAEVAESMGLTFERVEDVRCALMRAQSLAQDGDMIFTGGSNFVVAEIL